MLTADQRDSFELQGYVRLDQAISGATIARLSDAAWTRLEEYQIHRERPETWRRLRPKGIQSVAKTDAFDSMATAKVRDAIDALVGHNRWNEPSHWGQLLVSLPNDKEWQLPTTTWHIDLSENKQPSWIPGIQLFACVEDILPRGGATVAVAGSHTVVHRFLREEGQPRIRASSAIRGALSRRHSWFKELWRTTTSKNVRTEYFMSASTEIDGAHLQVVEFTGRAGDVFLMHPYVFHAPSANVCENPRIAITQRLTAV